MFKKFIDFVNGLGDWNHLFIGVMSQLVLSLIGFTGWEFITVIIYFTAAFFTVWYLSKEYHSYVGRLGYVKAIFMSLWERHDRRQSIIAWSGFWIYAFIYDKYLFNLLH